jgi:PAS domain S-box-containing protein
MSTLKILFADEENVDQIGIDSMIKEHNLSWDITYVDSFSKVAERCGKEDFDIILSEYLLGDGTVFDVLKLSGKIPVLFITGEGNEEAIVKALEKGAHSYIIKDMSANYRSLLPWMVENAVLKNEKGKNLIFLSEILDGIKDSVYVLDSEHRVVYVNRSFVHHYGYEPEEVFGRKGTILSGEISGDNPEEEFIDFETNHRNREGKILPVSLSKSCVREENGEKCYYVMISRDVSARKTVEKRKEAEKKDLVRKNRQEIEKRKEREQLATQQSKMAEMGEMMSFIIHQWKQPLSALAMVIQMMENGDLDQKTVREMVNRGLGQIDFLNKTLEEFRNFFKPSLEKTIFDVKKAIEEVLFMISPALEKQNIQTEIRDTRKKNSAVMGYANEFKQAILNLVNNARDAVLENNRNEGKIDILITEKEGKTFIRIQDNGPGIPEKNLDKIFERYFSTKEKDGTGLGLYVTRMIIEDRLNGKIIAENGEKGAVFTLAL